MNKLNILVEDLCKQHIGGQQFFSALDESVRLDEDYFQALWDEWNTMMYCECSIIVSGSFGIAFNNWVNRLRDNQEDFEVIVASGSLRHDAKLIESIDLFLAQRNYIFLDDSFYSGTTRNVIKNKIESKGGKLLHTFVVYDGAKTKDDSVTALYRYHP